MKHGVCIAIVEILFGFANGQISSIFDRVICPWPVFLFQDNNLSKSQRSFAQLHMCIDTVEIWFGFVIMIISSILSWHDNGGVLSFYVFI